jgi:AraC-like DNA-binding protein
VVIFLPSWLGDERFGGVSWLSLYATRPLRRPSVTTEEIRAEVLAIGRDVNREIIERAPAWESAVRLQVLRVLLTLSRCCQASTRGEGESAVRPNDLARLAPALDLVHADPTRHPTLAEAASLCGWSRVHFCRIFGRVMGTSFGEFCLQARLGVAARLLVGSDAPLATVAEDSGFSSASHLNRSFRKHYRSSPGQYRVQWRSS